MFRCLVADVAQLKVGDDAKSVKIVPLGEVLNLNLAFDHRKILMDYIARFHPNLSTKQLLES